MTTAIPASPESTVHASVLRADPSRLDEVFDRLRARVAAGALPSAAIAIGDADGEIARQTFAPPDKPLSTDSAFFLASVTKPIFATAFMQLIEDGRIDLHGRVDEVLPEFNVGADAQKARVTWWHLLTHTSGVPDVSPEVIRRSRPSAKRMTEMTLGAPLSFEPATRYEYCTATFYLMARAIERLSGLKYTRYLQEKVFDPLGMETTFDARKSRRPIVAVQGVGVENRLVRFVVVRYLAAAALPGGGLFGTLNDLLRFGAAIIRPVDGRVPIGRATFDLMAQDHLAGRVRGSWDDEEAPVHFGLSWGKPTLMRDMPGSPSTVSHGGATGTRLWIDPVTELVFVFFTNQWGQDRGPEVEAIRGIYRAMGWVS